MPNAFIIETKSLNSSVWGIATDRDIQLLAEIVVVIASFVAHVDAEGALRVGV